MSKTSRELVEFCRGKKGTPYVFGMKGQELTEALIQQLGKENPRVYTSEYITKARRFVGSHCTDGSGLISWCTGIVRGSTRYKETAVEVKPIGELNEKMVGWALWKPGHIGVYIGNGRCMESRDIDCGTVETLVQDTEWVSILKLKDIDYSDQSCDDTAQKTECVQEELRISEAGVCLIREFEGCRLETYCCAAGVPTIGYGHTAGVTMGMKITQEEAEAYLREDLRKFEKAVNNALKCRVTQNQFDALVSFAYNLGGGALRNSSLLKYLNAGDLKGAADEFPKWNKAAGRVVEGLTARRLKERKLFLS